MALFFLRTCDCSGRVLADRQVEARDLNAALVKANRRVCRAVARARDGRGDAPGRIDVADGEGRTVARLLFSEVAAALG